jgi:hypothetical protein
MTPHKRYFYHGHTATKKEAGHGLRGLVYVLNVIILDKTLSALIIRD